jgi:hypothetical protein
VRESAFAAIVEEFFNEIGHEKNFEENSRRSIVTRAPRSPPDLGRVRHSGEETDDA